MDDKAREVGAVLAEFAGVMAGDHTPRQILERLGDYITELLPVAGVGVLLRGATGIEVATANTETGRIVEELEAQLGEGPCTECIKTGEQILVPDLAAVAERYPRFVPRALEAGVKSIHALPMTVRTEQVGSMDVIAVEPLDLDAAQLSTAQMLADVAIAYLVSSRAFGETSKLATQLQYALDSRVVIEQAKGVLSERHGISVSDAFEIMRRHARSNQIKLHDVAGEIVRGDLTL